MHSFILFMLGIQTKNKGVNLTISISVFKVKSYSYI